MAIAGASISHEAIVILGAAALVIPLFHRLRVSPVLGYMLVGMTVGPFGFGAMVTRLPFLSWVTIADPDAIAPVAEFGVVLLLFMIGLELSFERLMRMRRLVLGMGLLQLLTCTAALAAIAVLAGQPAGAAIVVGLGLAMSSTAVIVQVLAEEGRLSAPVGRASFAILLFQDLAVVPVLFVVGALGAAPAGGGAGRLALGIAQAVLAVAAIVGLGRLVLRPLFRSVARTRSPELFVAACLLVALGTGLVAQAAGLSMPLGALVAGVLLAETEYRRQIEVTVEPFKGLFLGVFLISIGMSLDLSWLAAHLLLVLGGAAGLVLVKLVITTPLVRSFGLSWTTGLQAGLLLGPGGEFSFVILGLALGSGLIPSPAAKLGLAAAALTMSVIPLLSRLGAGLASRFEHRPGIDPELLPPEGPHAPRVIIAGFGRVGRMVASMLEVHGVAYVAIDHDADRVAQQRAASPHVHYGDMTRADLLRRLDLAGARALVVTLDRHEAAAELVGLARRERADLLIVARARDAEHAARLYGLGATDAVPEAIEASLQLSEAVLVDLGVPMGPVIASIHEKRADIQTQIRLMAPEAQIRPIGRRALRDAGRTASP